LLNITLISHDKIIGQKPIYAIQRKFRGTCSSIYSLGVHAHLSKCGRATGSDKGCEPLF